MHRIGYGLLIVLWLGAAQAETRGARVTGASSSLKGKTKVLKWAHGKPYWTGATFQPASAMDGDLTTSWCEGAPSPGIGQWIEVQTDRPTREVEIAGGFRKISLPEVEGPSDAKEMADFDEELEYYFEQSLGTYKSNGRPAVIELTTPDGKVLERFQMEDRILDRYRFRVSLPPGRYRLRIAQVFPGTRYEDTCIAELQFRDPEPAAGFPHDLPEPLRSFPAPETCRAASGVKVLPQEMMFLQVVPQNDVMVSDPGGRFEMEVRSPSGLLSPVLDSGNCIAGRGELACNVSGGDAREERLDRADVYPVWEVDLKTKTANTQGPWEWTGAYETVGWKVLYRLTVRPDATSKGPSS